MKKLDITQIVIKKEISIGQIAIAISILIFAILMFVACIVLTESLDGIHLHLEDISTVLFHLRG